MITKPKVLFVCIHNSARSQIAEGYLRHLASDLFEVKSAGLEAGTINPIAVEAMALDDIDISHHTAKPVWDMIKAGEWFAYVITVCDETSAERCPIFPGVTKRIHWSFPDPSALGGSHEEKLKTTVEIRDAIKEKVASWVEEQRNLSLE